MTTRSCADPLLPRVTGREADPRWQTLRTGDDFPPVLRLQPQATTKARREQWRRFIDETHFVAAGGQVKSMMSWLAYMKHGAGQERSMDLKLPAPNLEPDFEDQARKFADQLAASLATSSS